MNANDLLKGLCAVGLITVPQTEAEAQENKNSQEKRPNIIFILADDMGYCDLACYGNKYIETPNIDRLAATGTSFTQAYAGSGISSPSRCALMTGRNTGNTTIRDNFAVQGGLQGLKGTNVIRRMHLLPNDTTLATVLGAAGYRTCLVNKWHLDGFNPGATPLNRGFDEFYGWLISTAQSNDPYYYPYWRFDNYELKNIEANAADKRIKHNTDISTEDAIKFVQRNQNNPFFLYLAYDAPHEPYNIEETTWYDDEEWDMNTKRYASLITHMDRAIGRLLAELDRLGLRENTLIFFASDNGAAKQAPIEVLGCKGTLRGMKGQLYEGGIRVPFIVNQPGTVPVQKLDNLIYFPDVMPTLAAAAKAEDKLPTRRNGMNILPLIMGEEMPETDERMLYWEFPGKQRAARKGDWKVVTIKKDAPLELYNIRKDMTESNDLAKEYPELVEQFEREMKAGRVPSPNWPD
ncbi:MAG: sulfatase-like hydrolase/transferase [Bacteroidaceae bacterium]|nr:sulfatase-like hydrolase/transferase [Bacteroidaceae bacterium]